MEKAVCTVCVTENNKARKEGKKEERKEGREEGREGMKNVGEYRKEAEKWQIVKLERKSCPSNLVGYPIGLFSLCHWKDVERLLKEYERWQLEEMGSEWGAGV